MGQKNDQILKTGLNKTPARAFIISPYFVTPFNICFDGRIATLLLYRAIEKIGFLEKMRVLGFWFFGLATAHRMMITFNCEG